MNRPPGATECACCLQEKLKYFQCLSPPGFDSHPCVLLSPVPTTEFPNQGIAMVKYVEKKMRAKDNAL